MCIEFNNASRCVFERGKTDSKLAKSIVNLVRRYFSTQINSWARLKVE